MILSTRSESLAPCILEGDNVLDVPRLREEVEWLNVYSFVSVGHDVLRVSSLIAVHGAEFAKNRARAFDEPNVSSSPKTSPWSLARNKKKHKHSTQQGGTRPKAVGVLYGDSTTGCTLSARSRQVVGEMRIPKGQTGTFPAARKDSPVLTSHHNIGQHIFTGEKEEQVMRVLWVTRFFTTRSGPSTTLLRNMLKAVASLHSCHITSPSYTR